MNSLALKNNSEGVALTKNDDLAIFMSTDGSLSEDKMKAVMDSSQFLNPHDRFEKAFNNGHTKVSLGKGLDAFVLHTDEDPEDIRWRLVGEKTHSSQIGAVLNQHGQATRKAHTRDRLLAKLAKKKGMDVKPQDLRARFYHRDSNFQLLHDEMGNLQLTLFHKLATKEQTENLYASLEPLMRDEGTSPDTIVSFIKLWMARNGF